MTNNNNEENLHWEESTKHRDKYQKRNSIVAKTIEKGLAGINL